MSLTRIYLPIVSFLVAVTVVIAAAMLPFIPSWATFQVCSMVLGTLGLIAAGVWLLRGVWVQTRERIHIGFRWVLVVAIAALILMSLVGVLGCFLWFTNGPLRPQFLRQFEFPEYETTIYIYDPTMDQPDPVYRIQRGWLPFNEFLLTTDPKPGTWGADESMEVVQSGEWAIGEGFKVYLPTGRLEVLDE